MSSPLRLELMITRGAILDRRAQQGDVIGGYLRDCATCFLANELTQSYLLLTSPAADDCIGGAR